ncbi:MAG: HAD-IIB family hydrolase, partial [Solobacterium sp.]|nr:HAD-IIB family hydrolase [Solobacterium sp.]
MIKLIACDLDGTALNSQKVLDEGLKEILPHLESLGVGLTFITGRGEGIMQQYVDEINLQLPYVTDNGGNIYQQHHCLATEEMPCEAVNLLAKTLFDRGIPFTAYGAKSIHAFKNKESAFFTERTSYYDPYKIMYQDGIDLSNEKVFKITSDFDLHLEYLDEVKDIVSQNCAHIDFLNAEGNVYCANSQSANKGKALVKLCRMLDIQPEEVMAFGDNGTDMPML